MSNIFRKRYQVYLRHNHILQSFELVNCSLSWLGNVILMVLCIKTKPLPKKNQHIWITNKNCIHRFSSRKKSIFTTYTCGCILTTKFDELMSFKNSNNSFRLSLDQTKFAKLNPVSKYLATLVETFSNWKYLAGLSPIPIPKSHLNYRTSGVNLPTITRRSRGHIILAYY